MNLRFRFAKRDEYPRIAAFLDQYWAKDHIYVRSRNLFEWTFTRPGFWDDETYSFALAEDGDELAGILGGIPFGFNSFGQKTPGVWIVNYAMRPDYRKGTAAFQLLNTFRNERFPVVIAAGLNPATTTIYRVLRGQVLPEMPRHVLCLPQARDRFSKLLLLTHPELDEPRARRLSEAFTTELPTPAAGSWEAALPNTWDTQDWNEIACSSAGAVRDSAYFDWRYQRHPCFPYQFIVLREGGRNGLVVWRMETIRRQTETGRVDVDRIGRVLEFLPASAGNARSLISILLSELSKADAIGADFFSYHGHTRALLDGVGFKRCELNSDAGLIPTRFQPLDSDCGPMLNAMFAPATLGTCNASADCSWYWTKSDSDQDRPN